SALGALLDFRRPGADIVGVEVAIREPHRELKGFRASGSGKACKQGNGGCQYRDDPRGCNGLHRFLPRAFFSFLQKVKCRLRSRRVSSTAARRRDSTWQTGKLGFSGGKST